MSLTHGTSFDTSKENRPVIVLVIGYALAKRNNATVDYCTSSTGTVFNIRFDQKCNNAKLELV